MLGEVLLGVCGGWVVGGVGWVWGVCWGGEGGGDVHGCIRLVLELWSNDSV